jgi:hypothetical protein
VDTKYNNPIGARLSRWWWSSAAVIVAGVGIRPAGLQVCSAPRDVYGSKVVLYGCDGKVATVEHMPAHDFIYPSD